MRSPSTPPLPPADACSPTRTSLRDDHWLANSYLNRKGAIPFSWPPFYCSSISARLYDKFNVGESNQGISQVGCFEWHAFRVLRGSNHTFLPRSSSPLPNRPCQWDYYFCPSEMGKLLPWLIILSFIQTIRFPSKRTRLYEIFTN